MCISSQKMFRFYLKECSLHKLVVSFNFGFTHQFNLTNQLTLDYN